jgi:phosphatidate cytidylyltransferase
MLRARIITAVLLLAVLLPALFHPEPKAFVVLAWLFVIAGMWEWGRLNGLGQRLSLGLAGCLGGLAFSVWWLDGLSPPSSVWWGWGVFWVLGGALLLKRGVAGWGLLPVWLRLPAGYVALVMVWMSLDVLRQAGHNMLLSTLALVWAADVFAYFGGKAWGRRKLAPQISPGKSWAGAYTGAVGVVILAVVWVLMDRMLQTSVPSIYTLLWTRYGWLALLPLLGLVAMSVVGDLVESLVKRSAGMKDSSQLLPGHGGVLDRVDALLPVLPLAICVLG